MLKNLFDKSVEECTENIDRNEKICNSTLNDYGKIYNSCAIYKLLLVIDFSIIISISIVFIYFHCYLKKYNTDVYSNTNVNTETLIC